MSARDTRRTALMNRRWEDRVWQQVAGDDRTRVVLVVAVMGLLALASVVFVLGADVGLFGDDVGVSFGWLVAALVVAFVAGMVRAGLGPTVGSLWLVGLWWFVFPPLVGYLGGGWAPASRYNHPRMLLFAYPSARAELLGGLEYGVKYGLLFAIVGGLSAYAFGFVASRGATRISEHR